VTNVQSSDAGNYSVVVSNAYGTATSQNAALSLIGGTILLSDSFDDGERTTQTLPASAKWYSSSSTLSVSAGALSVAAGRHALAFFKNSGVQSLAVGEQLTASLTLNFSTVGNSSGGFRFGFFNSNGTARPPDPNNTTFTNYDGYIVTTTATYPDSNANTSGPITFRQRNTGVAGTLISTVGSGIYSDVAASPSTSQGFEAGTNYTVTLAIARTAAGTINLSVSVTGGALVNYLFTADDFAGIVTGFDGFAVLSTSSNGSTYTIDNVTVVHSAIPAPPSPLAAWRLTYFGMTNNTGVAANDADPDFDAIANLFEYILGLNPNTPNPTPPAAPSGTNVSGNDYLTLTFRRDLNATGISLTVQAGPDLSSWDNIDPDGPNQISSTTNDSMQTLTVRDNVPMNGATNRFMRLKATEP
jgi:hypothetical protein